MLAGIALLGLLLLAVVGLATFTRWIAPSAFCLAGLVGATLVSTRVDDTFAVVGTWALTFVAGLVVTNVVATYRSLGAAGPAETERAREARRVARATKARRRREARPAAEEQRREAA